MSERVTSIRFAEAVPFRGENHSMVVGPAGADSITPARIEPDGRAVPIEKGQAAGGWLLTRKFLDRVTGKTAVERVFVPMGLVRGVIYGE